MHRYLALWIVAFTTQFVAVGFCAETGTQPTPQSLSDSLWAFLQTPTAIAVIVAAWSIILAKVFTKKPKWQKYYEQYKGTLVEAVKYAEKAIPDDTENKSAARADAALKYALTVIGKANETELKQAINVVHEEVL